MSEVELCNAQSETGPCFLPAGHNRGQADIPANHQGHTEINPLSHEFLREVGLLVYSETYGHTPSPGVEKVMRALDSHGYKIVRR